jgi:hypothetical protein
MATDFRGEGVSTRTSEDECVMERSDASEGLSIAVAVGLPSKVIFHKLEYAQTMGVDKPFR